MLALRNFAQRLAAPAPRSCSHPRRMVCLVRAEAGAVLPPPHQPSTSAPVLPTPQPDVPSASGTPVLDSSVASVPVSVGVNCQQPQAFNFDEVMAFAGPAPGRLAMLGFLAAVGAELLTGQSVAQQAGRAAGLVLATSALCFVASLMPMLNGGDRLERFGPLTPTVERFNGQAAMLGFAALLVLEAVSGKALF